MSKDLNLDGVEISIIKALGFGGGDTTGKTLKERCGELEEAEIIDTLDGLISTGLVISDKDAFRSSEELNAANFHVNSGYIRALKSTLDPSQDAPKSRRLRRE